MNASVSHRILDYPVIDCDNHYYEPDDCFTRHIEQKYKSRTVWTDRSRADGIGRMMLGRERLNFFSVGVADYIGRPGAMEAFFQGDDARANRVNMDPVATADYPAFTEQKARLALMDEQGVQSCVMIPTLGVGVEYQLRDHPEILYPSLRAFNRWVHEDWGWGTEGRIFSVAVVSLLDVDEAVCELERLLREGLRLVHITAGPVAGKSPADEYFAPFWARVQEAGLKVVLHIGETGCNEHYAAPWGEPARPPSHRFTAFNTFVGIGARSITDFCASVIFHNLFERFPGLEFLVVEFGSAWVRDLLDSMDKIYRLGDHKSRWRYGKPERKPSESFRRHFRVTPFHEDDIASLAQCIGMENIINGSDFPHPEGLEWPMEMAHRLKDFSAADVRLVMRDNACRILGIER